MFRWTLGALIAVFTFFSFGAAIASEEKIEVGFPAPGTVLIFEKTVGDKKETLRWFAVDITHYKGRPVHRLIGDTGFEYYDAETKSWVATMLAGKLKEVSPHNGQLSSPLWVGKSWQAEHLYTRRDGSQAQQSRTWTVEARETISVPAGSFDTFRIKSVGKALTITLWYAPDINFYVRRVTEGMVSIEQQLLEVAMPR